jgi:hypothetical protein
MTVKYRYHCPVFGVCNVDEPEKYPIAAICHTELYKQCPNYIKKVEDRVARMRERKTMSKLEQQGLYHERN